MNFAEAIKNETKWTRTENGAIALNTTGTACLDLFGVIGALREASEARITSLFEEAYKENPLLATKILFMQEMLEVIKKQLVLEREECLELFLNMQLFIILNVSDPILI